MNEHSQDAAPADAFSGSKRKLSVYIALLLTLGLVVVLCAQALGIYYLGHSGLMRLAEDKISYVLQSQSNNAKNPLWLFESEQLDVIVQNLVQDNTVVAARITDMIGQSNNVVASVRGDLFSQDGATILSHPITYFHDGINKSIGVLEVVINYDEITRQSESMVMILIAATAISLAGIVFFTYVVLQRSIQPVTELSDKIAQMRFSDAKETISTNIYEIEQLDYALRKMREHYENSQQRLIAAKEEAEHVSQMKSEFLANMSHELRTPIHAILGFTRLSKRRLEKDADVDAIAQMLDTIDTSGKRLSSLVNDLLDLAKLESGSMEYLMAPVKVRDIVSDVAAELFVLAEEKKIELIHDVPEHSCSVQADYARLQQVLVNLFSNAIKFTPEGKAVSVHYEMNNHDHTMLLQVVDDGVGIPEEELESIFDKFIQSQRTKTGAGGTGLGLAICRQIINDHHGRIWASNNEQGGATFHIVLPMMQPETADAESESV